MKKASNSKICNRFYGIIALVICCVMVLGLISPIKANAAKKTKRYIVLTVDTSGSSNFYNSDYTELLYSASSPMTEVKNAATKFAESLADSEDDIYVSVISFGDTAKLVSGFTNDIENIKKSINNLSSVGGGKNMGAALKMADSQLSAITNSAAMKSVVLVSPGMCSTGEYSYTGHWNSSVVGGRWKNANSGVSIYAYSNSAYEYAESIKARDAKIYTIGLTKLMANCPDSVKDVAQLFQLVLTDIASEDCYYPVYDIDDFVFVFAEMTRDVVSGSAKTFDFAATGETDDYTAKYYFENAYFDEDAAVYNPSLSTMSLCFAISAFASNESDRSADSKKQWTNAFNLLNNIGFENIEENDDFKAQPQLDTMGVIAGMKTIESEDGDYTLIALATRGGNYFSEWGGNFKIGLTGNHYGFDTAKNVAKTFLNDYVSRYASEIKGTVKLWMAGYSRGGATVNLLAGEVTDSKKVGKNGEINVQPKDIFAYCFEPPRGLSTSVCSRQKAATYTNIHNIINPNDIVPLVAMDNWGFIRYGKDEKVLPDSVYTGTYNAKIASMMSYYIKLETTGVNNSYVSISEYEKQYDSIIAAIKSDAETKYNSWVATYNWYKNDPRINGILPEPVSFEESWSKKLTALVTGAESTNCADFVLNFREYPGYGIFETAYDYFNGIAAMKRHAIPLTEYSNPRLTDYISVIDLFKKCNLSDTFLTFKGLFAAKDKKYVPDYYYNMGIMNEIVVNGIADNLASRSVYYNEIQYGLSTLIQLIMGKDSPIKNMDIDFLKAIGGKKVVILTALDLAILGKVDGDVDVMYRSIISEFKDQGLDIDSYLNASERETFKSGLKKLIQAVIDSSATQEGTDALYSLIINGGSIGAAHYPELCLAWLQSQDKNYSDSNTRIYIPSGRRVIRINCPVDVTAYDKKGVMVAQFKDNVPQLIEGSCILSSFTNDGEKLINLPIDEEYSVVINAMDDGELNLSVNEFDMNDDCYYIENYHAIKINKGETITVNLPKEFYVDEDGNEISSCLGSVLSNADGVISNSVVLKGEDARTAVYAVKVSSDNENGGVCIGGGEYVLGSFAKVHAAEFEDCRFIGWYENGELVSENRDYRFKVTADRSLVAGFEGSTQYGKNGIFAAEIEAENGGFILGESSFEAFDGYPVTITAIPYEGYEFTGWTTSDNCSIEDPESFVTALRLIDSNVTVKALFTKSETDEPDDEQPIVIDGVTVTYALETSWDNGYNGTFTIENNSGLDITEWGLSFSLATEISDIWNAKIVQNIDGDYLVQNDGWNTKIAEGETITFGFTAIGDKDERPSNIQLFAKEFNKAEDRYKVEFIKNNEWSGGCIGELVITNVSDTAMKDWVLEFTCDNQLNSIWNGIIISNSDNVYTVKNAGDNSTIEPGASVRIGMNISFTDDVNIQNYNLICK